MGYTHRVWRSTCAKCSKSLLWIFRDEPRAPRPKWTCSCGTKNFVRSLPEWPEVPRSVYIGPDKARLLKLFPVPPEESSSSWAQPYSVRSFIFQASRAFGGCHYSCRQRGAVYDEIVYSDVCSDPRDESLDPDLWNCHILAGWSAGQTSCPLWELIRQLCQTETEQRFLHTYFRYVKDRQFPMLLPQVRVGIAERRRPDFVALVPLQYWRYKKVAVELDGAHPESAWENDAARDKHYEEHGYEVLSLRPGSKGYLEEVRSLVEKIEIWMSLAESDAWEVSVEALVKSYESDDDIPF